MLFRSTLALAATVILAGAAIPQKRTLSPEDYKTWELISARDISNDGHWLWYQVALVDGDGYLVVRNNDDKRIVKVPNGVSAAFSDDSHWCAYLVTPSKAEADKMREAHKPIENKLAIQQLDSGAVREFESVLTFKFLKGSHGLLIQRRTPSAGPDAASDLLVVNLPSLGVLPIPSVSDAVPNEAGTWLGLAVKVQGGESGFELLDMGSLLLHPLTFGKGDVQDITWSKNGNAVACLIGKKDEAKDGDFNRIFEASGLPSMPAEVGLDPTDKTWLPKGKRISESGGLSLNDDGTAVAFGIGDWNEKRKPADPAKPDEKAHPEVWNTKDLRTVPEQRVEAAEDRTRVDLAVWWPKTGSVVRVSDGPLQSAGLLKGFQNALVRDTKPYANAANDGFGYADEYLVDTATGKKTPVLTKTHWGAGASREGKYLTYYKDKNWWLYDVAAGKAQNLTARSGTTFENVEDDHTVPEKPPVMAPLWFAGDAGLLLGDEFDLYLAKPKGGLTRLTDGRKDRLVYRPIQVEDEPDGPDLGKPMFLSAFNKETKDSGFYAVDATGKGKLLVLQSARIGGLRKAKDVDRVVFTMGTFEKSPNLYITNQAFSAIKPESKTNPQQDKFLWGTSELVHYRSRWGKALEGILIYPAGYQKGKKYPMVTYIYERLSDNLNNYVGPNDANAYNVQILSQNGYFVFMPDIAYRGNTPGQNAVDCLEPAVAAVLAKDVGVMPDRIGLMGHSWGAYQTAFVTTVSSVFRVGVAGAPLTDLIGMYNTHYWNSGIPNQPLLETGQGRLRVPFWEDPKVYIDNSPVWQSMKRKTPILITVGDQDGAVDYHQGIALYNTLRRMGKDAVLLVYYGENHNFTKRPDQLDYAHRVRHYLDVYLKGVKPEPWISDGIPFLKKDD